MAAKKKWKMPKWMEPYRLAINNTGGNSIEELMDALKEKHLSQSNSVLWLLACCVDSQVNLLAKLHAEGMLK